MKMRRAEMCIAVFLAVCAGASATVLHVPGEYATIQAGINAAVDGDTVLVADGTYTARTQAMGIEISTSGGRR